MNSYLLRKLERIKELEAENERLRSALVEISEINTMVHSVDHAVMVAWRTLLAEENNDEL